MYNDEKFAKLFNTKGIWFKSIVPFMKDRRLTEPFAIINDAGMKFGEYESYPIELAIVADNNGY